MYEMLKYMDAAVSRCAYTRHLREWTNTHIHTCTHICNDNILTVVTHKPVHIHTHTHTNTHTHTQTNTHAHTQTHTTTHTSQIGVSVGMVTATRQHIEHVSQNTHPHTHTLGRSLCKCNSGRCASAIERYVHARNQTLSLLFMMSLA